VVAVFSPADPSYSQTALCHKAVYRCRWSALDRWFFCDNAWWRQEGAFEQVVQAGGPRGPV
jgi:hypothetical protein